MVWLSESCQEKLISFIFFLHFFLLGFVVYVKNCIRKDIHDTDNFSFTEASLIKGTKQYAVGILLHPFPRGQEKGDTNEKRTMQDADVDCCLAY